MAAKDAVDFIGLPEGRIPLAEAAVYLATAPKSNRSFEAMLAAGEDVSGYRFYAFDNGMTVYFPPDMVVLMTPSVSDA